MKTADFTIKLIRANPHREKTITWRAGQIVTGMEGCKVANIVWALRYLEEDTGEAGVGDPARWLTQFAGLESQGSGKSMERWIDIMHAGQPVSEHTELPRSAEVPTSSRDSRSARAKRPGAKAS